MSTILITGGAKRVGKATALYLAKHGFDIALHYNSSEQDALEVQKEIEVLNQKCTLFQQKLGGEESCKALISSALKSFPDLMGLINNASSFKAGKTAETTEALFDSQINDNLKTPLFLSKYFQSEVKAGVIVNLVDTYIHRNPFNHTAYILAKKALAELTKLNAREFAPNIRVNAVAPGLILPSSPEEEELFEKLIAKTPLQRQGRPEEIAQAIYFLITCQYITGEIITVDGGKSLV